MVWYTRLHFDFVDKVVNLPPSSNPKHITVRDRTPGPLFYRMLGQSHVNGWSRVIVSQNGGSTDYIFSLRLGIRILSIFIWNGEGPVKGPDLLKINQRLKLCHVNWNSSHLTLQVQLGLTNLTLQVHKGLTTLTQPGLNSSLKLLKFTE